MARPWHLERQLFERPSSGVVAAGGHGLPTVLQRAAVQGPERQR